MLPADWLAYIAEAERTIQRPPAPPKRRQPKVTRHQSPRMRQIQGQTINPIKAIYGEENERNQTPTMPETWRGTKEVGPGDVHNSEVSWRTGNQTIEGRVTGAKRTPQQRRNGTGSKTKKADLSDLMKEYGL